MSESIDKRAGEFLKTPEGQKLAEKRPELEKLVASSDGQRVRELLGGAELERAAKSGDIGTLAAAVKKALSTQEGARLAGQLRELMK
ncbi:MAG: hypothetical protein LBN99_01030 [Oscillospiraceae bacterium]|jgi:hypothetical protein|nr:hypothetical protein [Oscillospiraceae bacterium]